jgi:hypothetical protein
VTTLGRLAKLIRSKNAGPFMLTIDIMFSDSDSYRTVVASGVVNPGRIAEIFGLPQDDVAVYEVDAALAIKVSFPRPVPSGSIHDSDIFGGQQFAPLVTLEVPS